MTRILEARSGQKETQDLSHCGHVVRNTVTHLQDRQRGTEIIFCFALLHFIKTVVLKLEDLRGIRSCLRKYFHSLEKQRNLGGRIKWINLCFYGI